MKKISKNKKASLKKKVEKTGSDVKENIKEDAKKIVKKTREVAGKAKREYNSPRGKKVRE
jgi:hypothetical protein